MILISQIKSSFVGMHNKIPVKFYRKLLKTKIICAIIDYQDDKQIVWMIRKIQMKGRDITCQIRPQHRKNTVS